MYRLFIKRSVDFFFALFALILLSPLMLIVGVLLFVSNRGSVFFVQQRPGKNEKIFSVYKFKTMSNGIDAAGNLLPDKDRLTAVGKFLRATSMDELPQLVNVLLGDMSLIGPRPLLPKYLPLYSNEQKIRHQVKPGITGWAQVNGRNAIGWKQKFEYDTWYVKNYNFLLDLKIIILTLKKIIVREGITANDSATISPFTGNH